MHNHDGEWPDLGPSGDAARLAFVALWERTLRDLPEESLTPDERIDRDLILGAARGRTLVVTLEESVVTGGFGAAVLEVIETARLTDPALREVVVRTIGIALAVTVVDALLALPIAYYMARVASPRKRAALLIAVTMPLWASYLVKVYAWRTMLQGNGFLTWILEPLGISAPGLGEISNTWIVLSYLWLPYMILPIYAGIERIPNSLLEASADLGGRAGMTFRRVILPLLIPSLAAGSIFTFSLSLGD